jgi:regulatory protein
MKEFIKKAAWTKDIALLEMKKWCAVDEKSHSQVRTKLIEHQVYGDELEEIIAELISENFLNETRYAMAYASGKFKINQWGKNKIKIGLKQKFISTYNINKAINSIDEDDYMALLNKLFEQKKKEVNIKTIAGKQKLINFLLQRGFEQHLIFDLLNTASDL